MKSLSKNEQNTINGGLVMAPSKNLPIRSTDIWDGLNPGYIPVCIIRVPGGLVSL